MINSIVPIQQSPAINRNSRPNSPSILKQLPVNARIQKPQSSCSSKSLPDDRPLSSKRPKRSCTAAVTYHSVALIPHSVAVTPHSLAGTTSRPVASGYFNT